MSFQNLGHNKPGVQWINTLTQTSKKKSSSPQPNCPSAAGQITHLLWNPKVHYRDHNSRHQSLSWARCSQSTSSHFICIRQDII